MIDRVFGPLSAEIRKVKTCHSIGRITGLRSSGIEVSGLSRVAALGDLLYLETGLLAEVVQLTPKGCLALPEGGGDGLKIGMSAAHRGPRDLSPGRHWIGRVIDPNGVPLDGRPLFPGPNTVAIRAAPPQATNRESLGTRLTTGLTAFDTMLPLVQGQRIGLFAGSGVGKSTLLSQLATGVEADVIVIGLVGERGREVREFIDVTLGPEGLKRAVVVAATSDRSALTRRRAAHTTMAIAEYFSAQGAHVLMLMDSVTRFAEAHREVAVASGEEAGLRGYPASLTQEIMSLCERAGPGLPGFGQITAIFSVLVAGSNMEEPIADILRGVLDGHVVLDRKIAERGRYPAIDILRSVSRSLPKAATEPENALIAQVRKYLGAYDRAELMIRAGLYEPGSDPVTDRAVLIWPLLDAFLAETGERKIVRSFEKLSQIIDHVQIGLTAEKA
jgi:flagellum-specific ATP synthase